MKLSVEYFFLLCQQIFHTKHTQTYTHAPTHPHKPHPHTHTYTHAHTQTQKHTHCIMMGKTITLILQLHNN